MPVGAILKLTLEVGKVLQNFRGIRRFPEVSMLVRAAVLKNLIRS
jgi:hypothetical protein